MHLRKYLSLLSILSLVLLLVSGCTDTPSSHRSWASTSSTTTKNPPIPTAPSLPRADVLLDVQAIPQYPDYPTGCESVSAVMALQYAGIQITVDDFIDNHLVCDNYNFYWMDDVLHGPDPYSVFIGDPRSQSSYGCMAPVIENALHSCVGNKKKIINTTGQSLSDLCDTYINQDIPVILWATMEMRPAEEGTKWYLPNGKLFTWPSGEHCLLLIGYNDTNYFFNDPLSGTTVAYDKALVEKSYHSLGEQSLVIVQKKAPQTTSAESFLLEEGHLTGFGNTGCNIQVTERL